MQRYRRSLYLCVFLGFTAGPTLAARVKVQPHLNDYDATTYDFKMPAFDKIARVRDHMLKQAGIPTKTAAEVVNFLGEGAKALKGITQEVWTDTEKPVAPKLKTFFDTENQNPKHARDGELDFSEFMKLAASLDPSWKPPRKWKPVSRPASTSDVKVVAGWLSATFGYWSKTPTGSAGYRVAQDWKKENHCDDFQNCPEFDSLCKFVALDTNKDGGLNFEEAFPALPLSEAPGSLEWAAVAALEKEDFVNLKFPNTLTESLIELSDEGVINEAKFEELGLQTTITDFIERDKRPLKKRLTKDTFTGKVKFSQMADLLPHELISEGADAGKVMGIIRGVPQAINVPSFNDIAGADTQGLTEISPSQLERWLMDEEVGNGMKNQWHWGTRKKAFASRMAKDVVRWGEGESPGGPERIGHANGRLQGPDTSFDQFTDVAPRLALFVALDDDQDGKLEFAKVQPYLLADSVAKAEA
jgi:hypothetical protein